MTSCESFKINVKENGGHDGSMTPLSSLSIYGYGLNYDFCNNGRKEMHVCHVFTYTYHVIY